MRCCTVVLGAATLEMPAALVRRCHWLETFEPRLNGRSSHDRLRQRSSLITTLTASLAPFSLLESLYRPTAHIYKASLALRGVCFIIWSCRFSASLTGLDLHYASSGVYMQTSNQPVIRAQHLRAQLSFNLESNASSTNSARSFVPTAQFCSR